MKPLKQKNNSIISCILAIILLLNCALPVSASSNPLWNTKNMETSIVLKSNLSKTQKNKLSSYQKNDSTVGGTVSSADLKQVKKALDSVVKYVFNFDYSQYEGKAQKTEWHNQIKKILPSFSSKQRTSLWKTRINEKQIKTTTPLTAKKYVTYQKGTKNRIIVYWAINYTKPQISEDTTYSLLKTVIKKTKNRYVVTSISEKYIKPTNNDKNNNTSSDNQDSINIPQPSTNNTSGGSGIIFGGGGSSNGNSGSTDSDNDSSNNNSSDSTEQPSDDNNESTDSVTYVGDIVWPESV